MFASAVIIRRYELKRLLCALCDGMPGNMRGLERRRRQKISDADQEFRRTCFDGAERTKVRDACGINHNFNWYRCWNGFGLFVRICWTTVIDQN